MIPVDLTVNGVDVSPLSIIATRSGSHIQSVM